VRREKKGGTHKEGFRGDGGGVEVYGPVHECLRAANGEDDGIHVVHGDGFYEHCFCAFPPIGID